MAKKLTAVEMHRLARIGAAARLAELEQEIAALKRAFPGLQAAGGPGGRAARRWRPATSGPGPSVPRSRPPQADERGERKVVSERMKRYWDGAQESGATEIGRSGNGGAGYGNRTRLAGLGSQSITTMLSPPVRHACADRRRTTRRF